MLSIRALHLTLIAITSFCLQYSTAYPIRDRGQEVLGDAQNSYATCDGIETYTTEWFLANTLPAYRHEIYEHALFYTRGTSRRARDLAKTSRGEYVTIWEVWPCWLYDDRQVEENRLRCIHHEPEVRRTFYENMSRAFARMARKNATVMHSFKDYVQPPEDGIWARVELPALREKTDVDQLRKMNEDKSLFATSSITRDPWETVKLVIQTAMDEVRAIFRRAKLRTSDSTGAACSIWSSADDNWLDSLW
ncbi:hypothetical protein LTR36_001910 [Oleoguttula mirabilis]|uniref:Uncharacterized protein n=1 Tax=Oleoguttula mirabilis TaxID=1507867 RepID=A0AAV9JNL4_9PEZI|nr:hypothetical protein LTR36_001910 [Oleoguttula mirabilis]